MLSIEDAITDKKLFYCHLSLIFLKEDDLEPKLSSKVN